MSERKNDLTGRIFGYLTAITYSKEIGKPARYLCLCICGKEVRVLPGNLIAGSPSSCGCKTKELRSKSHSSHGASLTPEFRLLAKIKGFCYNPNHPNYSQYGAKGVTVCDRWLLDSSAFLSDIGAKPSDKHTLQRINESGNFEPSNCEWREIDKTKTNINLTKNLSKRRILLDGKRFGRLTVISFSHLDDTKTAHWLCKCDCGNTCTPSNRSLRKGATQSCGCLHKEQLSERNATHRSSSTKEYYIWNNMRERCSSPKNNHYKYYGGRGIKVCKRWLDFSNFIADMGYAPEGYSIERINNDGDYEPSNCKWIPMSEQAANKSNNHRIEYEGRNLHLAAWARELNLPYDALKYLLNYKKLSFPDAIAELKRRGKC